MATREENIKKINAKLEILSEKELESVAGGKFALTASNSKLLYEYGFIDEYYNLSTIMDNWGKNREKVEIGWEKAGIRCVTDRTKNNLYYLKEEQITGDEAIEYLETHFKKIHSV